MNSFVNKHLPTPTEDWKVPLCGRLNNDLRSEAGTPNAQGDSSWLSQKYYWALEKHPLLPATTISPSSNLRHAHASPTFPSVSLLPSAPSSWTFPRLWFSDTITDPAISHKVILSISHQPDPSPDFQTPISNFLQDSSFIYLKQDSYTSGQNKKNSHISDCS